MEILINYNGEYPCLCMGDLTVTIDGTVYKFPNYSLSSGGNVNYNEELNDFNVSQGSWSVDYWPENFPEEFKKPVLDKINEEIPWGCCGGCI